MYTSRTGAYTNQPGKVLQTNKVIEYIYIYIYMKFLTDLYNFFTCLTKGRDQIAAASARQHMQMQ
jgi:hypothetical protein